MKRIYQLIIVTLLCSVWTIGAQADEHYDRHERRGAERGMERGFHDRREVPTPRGRFEMDARFGHNRPYPSVGISYRTLPSGYYTTHYRGSPYYFHGGAWYRRGGVGYVVVRPPTGLYINYLPPFYTTLWFGGVRYYYADNVYYRWDAGQDVYVVSDPPANVTATNSVPSEPPSDETFVYPKNGQSEEQKATDRYECYRWAADQTGFDPTKTSGGVDAAEISNKRNDYKRAEAACLDARGYSVK